MDYTLLTMFVKEVSYIGSGDIDTGNLVDDWNGYAPIWGEPKIDYKQAIEAAQHVYNDRQSLYEGSIQVCGSSAAGMNCSEPIPYVWITEQDLVPVLRECGVSDMILAKIDKIQKEIL